MRSQSKQVGTYSNICKISLKLKLIRDIEGSSILPRDYYPRRHYYPKHIYTKPWERNFIKKCSTRFKDKGIASIDGLSEQNVNTKISELSDTIHWMNLTVIYRTYHLKPKNMQSIQQHRQTFLKRTISWDTTQIKIEKIEITSYVFLDSNAIKLKLTANRSLANIQSPR